MKTTIRLTILAALCAALAACGSSQAAQPSQSPTDAVVVSETAQEPTPTPSLNQDDVTRLAVAMTWDQQTETDKDSMCTGVALFGHDWVVESLQSGVGPGTSDLNWDLAANYIEDQCALR